MRTIPKPEPGKYPDYAEMYMKLLPANGLVLKHLADNFLTVKDFISSLPPEKLLYRYSEDNWTIKEILVHIVGDERIYAYRALCFARNEKQSLPIGTGTIFAPARKSARLHPAVVRLPGSFQ